MTANRPLLVGLGAIALAWLALALAVPAEPFNIDGVIHLLGVQAMAERGSLVIENGQALLDSSSLRPFLTLRGPLGDTPQYPSGFFVFAAPAHALLGARGVMLTNALAAIAVLVLTHRLAVRLFGDARLGLVAALILAAATYLPDYAVAIWPHATATLVVTGAVLCVAEAVLGPRERAGPAALLAGLLIGFGCILRVDAVLAGPPLAAWTLLFAARPLQLAVWGLAGLLPGLAAATWLNWLKFGIAFPVSYGGQEGAVNPASYVWLAAAAILALGLCAALRLPGVRRRWGWAALAAAAGLAAAAFASPRLAEILSRLGHGAAGLLWDMRLNPDIRPEVTRLPDGTVYFWGLVKTSLLQSLPWLGVLAVLAVRRGERADAPGLVLLALFPLLWMLPFLISAWHGGAGNNLRYFLPMLPALAILAAFSARELTRRAGRGSGWAFGLALAAALAAYAGLAARSGLLAPEGGVHAALVTAQYALPQWLMLALAAASLAAGLGTAPAPVLASAAPAPVLASAARGLLGAALVVGFLAGSLHDPLISHTLRGRAEQREARAASLPPDNLVLSVYPYLTQFRRDGAYQARLMPGPEGTAVADEALLRRAFAHGLRVYLRGEEHAGATLRAHPWLSATRVPGWEEHPLFELAPIGE